MSCSCCYDFWVNCATCCFSFSISLSRRGEGGAGWTGAGLGDALGGDGRGCGAGLLPVSIFIAFLTRNIRAKKNGSGGSKKAVF